MIIIHNYDPVYTNKLMEMGIAQKGDGFKITHCYTTKKSRYFNLFGAEDGKLFKFISENASCFYIDRLQGGVFYFDYPFDMELCKKYNEITNGNFLGFQLHEFASTRMYDWRRIKKCIDESGLEWNSENIYKSVRDISDNYNFPHFSQGPAQEYAAMKMPETMSEYFKDLDVILKKRLKKTEGMLFLCESVKMSCGFEKENNIKLAFIEVGGQEQYIRLQFAIRRGISRANGSKWGVYLEPWNVTDYSAYCFMKNGENEWNLTFEDCPTYAAKGANGGSSMSLARRLMYYSLFAGAQYFAEEWGQANTFYDWESFELSPYGKIKKDFIELSRSLKNVVPYVPCAIVIPRELKVFMTLKQKSDPENDVTDREYFEYTKIINKLFYNNSQYGIEDRFLTTGRYGSLFDIIYDDSYEDCRDKYDFIIDYSGRIEKVGNVADGFSEEETFKALDGYFEKNLPFEFDSSGDTDFMMFENDGEKYLAFFNHNGITKTFVDGEKANSDADITVNIKMKHGKIDRIYNICGSDFKNMGDSISIRLCAGDLILFCCK